MTETNKFENLFDNNTSSENRIFTFAFDRGRKIANSQTRAGNSRFSPFRIIKMTKRNSSFSEKQNR